MVAHQASSVKRGVSLHRKAGVKKLTSTKIIAPLPFWLECLLAEFSLAAGCYSEKTRNSGVLQVQDTVSEYLKLRNKVVIDLQT